MGCSSDAIITTMMIINGKGSENGNILTNFMNLEYNIFTSGLLITALNKKRSSLEIIPNF